MESAVVVNVLVTITQSQRRQGENDQCLWVAVEKSWILLSEGQVQPVIIPKEHGVAVFLDGRTIENMNVRWRTRVHSATTRPQPSYLIRQLLRGLTLIWSTLKLVRCTRYTAALQVGRVWLATHCPCVPKRIVVQTEVVYYQQLLIVDVDNQLKGNRRSPEAPEVMIWYDQNSDVHEAGQNVSSCQPGWNNVNKYHQHTIQCTWRLESYQVFEQYLPVGP